MNHESDHKFDRDYREQHWRDAAADPSHHSSADPSPYLVAAVQALPPGRALDAGCGTGGDAVWLAGQGWQVTGADISPTALAEAAQRAAYASVSNRTRWVEADLTSWEPAERVDLVLTSYAHPAMPQLAFYQRVAEWVAPGGTLLIVGHTHPAESDGHHRGHGHHHGHGVDDPDEFAPPEETLVSVSQITDLLEPALWRITLAEERNRSVPTSTGHMELHDVVVRASRRTEAPRP